MTATALGPAANSVVGSLCIGAPLAESRRLIVWVTTWPERTWAIKSVWGDIADSREVVENLKVRAAPIREILALMLSAPWAVLLERVNLSPHLRLGDLA